MVHTLRWGILGAGHISSKFVADLLLDPKTRDVDDVVHHVTGVGSRDAAKAQEFIDKYIPPGSEAHKRAKAYGSYDDLVAAKDIDVIYIGVPHTHHYDTTVLCLNAGKHVLIEKPATTNAAEFKALVALAKEKNLFMMEAMWTRFLPVALAMKKVIESGDLGDLKVLHADLAGDFDVDNLPVTHRILDPALGGGALLDLGPYPLIWAILAQYEDPRNDKSPPTRVAGAMVKTENTQVDSSTCFVLDFQKLGSQAILSCSITISSPPQYALLIRFRNGNIVVPAPIYRPNSFTVQYFSKPGSGEVVREQTHDQFAKELVGGGWHYQADEVARCIRDGKIQSELWGWDKTLLQMEIFDEVRKQGGYVLPPGVEKVV